MGLDYNLGKIENFREVCYQPDGEGMFDLNTATFALIFLTIPIGMHQITEANHMEFFMRCSLWEQTQAAMRRDPEGELAFVTYEEVRQHIGLSTNAATRTKREFLALVEKQIDRVKV